MQSTAEITPNLPNDIFFLLDPDQRNAVQTANTGDNAWIFGGDQTKRLQVMAQLVISKIFEGETVLVCAGPETEARIMETLRSIGLDSFYFHLRGQVSKPALGAMQLAKKKGVKEDTTSPTALAITQYGRWNEKIASRYSSINRQIFGDLTWQQLAEKAAIGPDPTYKGLLAASLNPSELELSLQEFWHLRGRIKKFQRLRVLRTPAFDLLESLHEQVFAEANEAEIKMVTQTALADVVSRGRQLLARVGSLVHLYRRDVSGHHHESLNALRCEIDRIEELIDQGMARYGNDFILESTFNDITGKLKKSISRKYQEMSTARNEVVQGHVDVMTTLQNSAFALHDNSSWETPDGLEHLRSRLQEMREYLVVKAREIESNALTHKKRLNAQNISSSHALQSNIQEVEKGIETFVYWVNSQKILQEHIEVNALSLEKRSHVVQQVVLKCNRLIEAMSDFEAYYLWQNFWRQQAPIVKTLLDSLDILEDEVQLDAFDAWYFENVLDQVPESHMTNDKFPVDQRKDKLRDIRAVVTHHMRVQLQNKRHSTLKEIRSKSKALISAISNARLSTVSDELHVLPAQSLSKLFPVVFCTPGQLRDYGYYFDTLLVSDNNGGDFQAYQAQSKQCVFVTNAISSGVINSQKDIKVARLQVMSLGRSFKWNDLPASDKLQLLNGLASQFAPYLSHIRIYNAREVQIFSFLGETTDAYLLREVAMPYKVVGEGQRLEVKHITEALLDSRKPIVLLTRDSIMHFDEGQDLFWQESALRLLSDANITVLNSSSIDLKKSGLAVMRSIVESVRTQRLIQPLPNESSANRKHA